ncbi:hypothetical protein AARAC_007798 [Aspergillus arachidicola]|uniref:EF-hand domain-containing protein n=1 Tax=Aspergillus arachidicola TaxID=656916 RepID=A0A2G7FJ62_9EURO|nr:hypothetical protein AARAC_007798 [Aspergillus arachidicola]
MSDEDRQAGTVKWFNDEKGFGFITPDNGTIDFDEFDKFVKTYPELGIENTRDRFDKLDDNGNGSISLSEFVDGFGKLVVDPEIKRAFYEKHQLVDPES